MRVLYTDRLNAHKAWAPERGGCTSWSALEAQSEWPRSIKKSAQTHIYQIEALGQLTKVTTVPFRKSGLQKKYGTKHVFLGLFWAGSQGAAGMAAADLTDMDTTAGNSGEGRRSGGPAKKKKKSKKRSGRKARMTFIQRRDERG